ncbi:MULTISPECIES: TerC family protein [unclassified Methanoculleus]|uniref:TerC family protein n=1 Tax=unclassified Methanoculleus TaxID=2619537 RepID=UPI0025F54897|nr:MULTISPECIES: TerC family protein [unclassified Methanoculleus]MCK9317318.1 TerC family protein [Methanoculleus sp.]MDD2253020.1 TerC family protein [Methanoculleus sp.]MDD2788690.1 TerC family protein [Methanoculleus sp.]MDD3216249.1 TerC family protein [Methanoculleus sp.]MDD4313866.1 TerC family protein [Methanoculleus sp.]
MTDAAWIIFIISIVALLALDLGVFNRKAHIIKPREALLQVAVFIAAAVIFNIGIYIWMGPQAGLEFTTGYIMELMLSVDNLFVFVIVFASFCVPAEDQHKVLFYGILGALVFRFAFITAGVALVETFSWMLYLFGAFLIFTAIRMVTKKEEAAVEPDKNILVRAFRKIMPVTKGYEGDKFFVKKRDATGNLVTWATPMFVTLLVVETTDIMFAVDSIPAILGITTNSFIVFSSNAFAILGLRSMYFALAHVMNAFCYLKYGLAGILSFVGVKMLFADLYHVPVTNSLAVIILILAVAIVASLIRTRRTGTCPVMEEVQAAACPALRSLDADDSPATRAETACPALEELRETGNDNK